jgi:hypothetical protein
MKRPSTRRGLHSIIYDIAPVRASSDGISGGRSGRIKPAVRRCSPHLPRQSQARSQSFGPHPCCTIHAGGPCSPRLARRGEGEGRGGRPQATNCGVPRAPLGPRARRADDPSAKHVSWATRARLRPPWHDRGGTDGSRPASTAALHVSSAVLQRTRVSLDWPWAPFASAVAAAADVPPGSGMILPRRHGHGEARYDVCGIVLWGAGCVRFRYEIVDM